MSKEELEDISKVNDQINTHFTKTIKDTEEAYKELVELHGNKAYYHFGGALKAVAEVKKNLLGLSIVKT